MLSARNAWLRGCAVRLAAVAPTLLLLGLTIAARWHFFDVPLISDEGGYAYVARFCGPDHALYRDLPFDRPQGIFLLYEIPVLLGGSPWAIRAFAALYAGVAVVALRACARDLFGPRAGWVAAVAGAVFGAAPSIEGFTANAELFTLLPLTLSAHAAWRGRFGVAGLLAGAAAFVKPSGVSGLVLAGTWALVAGVPRWRALIAGAIGFSVGPVVSVLHGASVDFDAYLASFLDRRLFLYSGFASPLEHQLRLLHRALAESAPAWSALAAAAIVQVARSRGRTSAFGVLWLASTWVGMALGGEWHVHYFQQMIPPLALLAGGAVETLRLTRWRAAWFAPAAAGLAIFFAVDGAYWRRSPLAVSISLWHRLPYLFAEHAGAVIAARTRPDDRVYVAVAEPEVYVHARRRAAIPSLFYRELLQPQVRSQVLGALARGVPAVVAVAGSPPGMSHDDLSALLSSSYVLVDRVGPFEIWDRRDRLAAPSGASEPLTPP